MYIYIDQALVFPKLTEVYLFWKVKPYDFNDYFDLLNTPLVRIPLVLRYYTHVGQIVNICRIPYRKTVYISYVDKNVTFIRVKHEPFNDVYFIFQLIPGIGDA